MYFFGPPYTYVIGKPFWIAHSLLKHIMKFIRLKKSQDIRVKYYWGLEDKKICVLSITPTTLGKLVISWNLQIISASLCLVGAWLYIPNNPFWEVSTLQKISVYFLIIIFLQVYKLSIVVHEKPFANWYITNKICFLMGTGGLTNILTMRRKNGVSSETKYFLCQKTHSLNFAVFEVQHLENGVLYIILQHHDRCFVSTWSITIVVENATSKNIQQQWENIEPQHYTPINPMLAS